MQNSKMSRQLVIFAALVASTMAQRPSFAGSRGSGYKDGLLPQTTSNSDAIGIRNGESVTMRTPSPTLNSIPNLPIDARGDAYLVNHFNNLPLDQRPFWILNQQHIEAQRGTPSRRPIQSADNTIGIGQNIFNGQNFPTRINDADDVFNKQIASNQNGTPQSGVVYPSNTTPEQRLDMEIQFLQQRLNGLIQIRNQLQQRNQNNQLGRLR